jgi:NADH:ubiquinone oxidoreductase subunit K
MIPLSWHLCLAAILFAIGLCGALTRRNAIIVLISIEIMFNAANLNLIAFWAYSEHATTVLAGQMFVLFTIAIAAAEAAVGLALVIAIFRHYKSVDVTQVKELKG